jgi:hypothetical protein
MQTNEVGLVMEETWVLEDFLLKETLCKLNREGQFQKIYELMFQYALAGKNDVAKNYMELLWPAILEHFSSRYPRMVAKTEKIELPDSKKQKASTSLLSIVFSENEAGHIDEALETYASYLEKLILRLGIENKLVHTPIIEKAGYELLSAAHLMSNPETASGYFSCFMNTLAGHQSKIYEGGTLAHSPDILRKSLRDIPVIKKHGPEKNMVAYLSKIEKRLKDEDERKAYDIIHEMKQIICIGICKTTLLESVCQYLLGKANPEDGKK